MSSRPPVLAVVVCLALMLLLVLAYSVGERHRCERLRAAHSPHAARYCPTEPSR